MYLGPMYRCVFVALATLLAPAPLPAVTADSVRHETFTLSSLVLGEVRTINVYTPPGYASDTAAFPVLYMLDGGMAEDFPHVANTIDSLIRLRLIPPVLVVGIENTERRRDLTGPTTVAKDSAIAPRVGGSAAFRSFIRDELMNDVRRRYRVTSEAAIVGESLAGLFVVETLLLDPFLFRGYIALSPSVWWNGGEAVRMAHARIGALSGTQRVLYLAAANETQIAEGTAELASILKAQSPDGVVLFYDPRPDLAHDTIFRALAPAAFTRVLEESAFDPD
jgi:predicted alpha/beta superfamily hydrolase